MTYRDKQRQSHFESFANKIYTGIREIKPEYAEKRAIWELFQNALDTVDKNGVVEIEKTQNGLLFKHNGKPFKDDEFGGLIKQFSVGKTYGDNKEKLGQYGTGFISTHVYGKKIIINGSIQTDDGTYRTLKGFQLDRDAISIEELTKKLLAQDDFIEKLCDMGEPESPMAFTSFEYQASESARIHIDQMLKYIESVLPYIFCFNDKLSEVTLLPGTAKQVYKREGTSNGMVHISKNDEPLNIPFIQNNESNVRVVLGAEARVLNGIPKQFLFYPLMETAEVGYNFIVHANDFKPNKERDYLHRDNANEELSGDVKTNEKLLETAFELVLKRIKEDENVSILDIARIEFTDLDSDFEKQLKRKYIGEIISLKRLDAKGEKYSVDKIEFFDESVLLLDEDTRNSIYELLKQFRDLPSFKTYCELSKYANNWNANIDKKLSVISLASIGEIIEKECGGNYFYILDKIAFQKFISQVAENITLLNSIAIIPNIHGDFKHFEKLVKWESNEPELVEMVDSINTSISDKYIHKDFYFIKNISTYNRERFKDDFSGFCNNLVDNIQKGNSAWPPDSVRFSMLLQSLKNFVALNNKTQLNVEVATFYEGIFQLNPHPGEISNPTVDINYQPAIKLLANLYIKSVPSNEVKNHVSDLMEILSIMFKNTNLKEELLHRLECIPDQNFVLRSQTELKRDDVKDSDFKNIYDTITNKKVRDELAYEGFEVFLQHSGSISGSYLGEAIETSLNKNKIFIPVDNAIIDEVLGLVEKISEKPDTWGQWLPNINRVKEEILMHKFKNEKTRSSLFSILTKNEKTIELLGDLAKIENLEDLVKKGMEGQQEENRKSNHLKYISYIGLTIQNLIEEQLGIELASIVSVLKSEENKELITKEEQNGQDFIIYKNTIPIYYIEVKSKWDENGRFALSKNQTEKCAAEQNRYAVISVNVDRYKKAHAINIDDIPFEDLKEFVKVNDNLGKAFEKLILENKSKVELNDPKLIEYRGSIPQKLIDDQGIGFDTFIKDLIQKIRIANVQ